MKIRTIFFAFLLAGSFSCVKENTPTGALDEQPSPNSTVVRSGMFINGPYGTVSGNAKLLSSNNKFTLALVNVMISNGPDLHVYLSKERIPVNYLDLGSLRSISGNQLYTAGTDINLDEYKYALIHCQRYNHLFGSAELK